MEPCRLGERTRIGLVVMRPVAVEGELVEEMSSRRQGRLGFVDEAVDRHGQVLLTCGRAHSRPSGDLFAGSG